MARRGIACYECDLNEDEEILGFAGRRGLVLEDSRVSLGRYLLPGDDDTVFDGISVILA
jgi:hypothetical protein